MLAVTVLTSMDAAQLKDGGNRRTAASQVELLARMAWETGIRGFVCSPEEVAAARADRPGRSLVTPGIRPSGADVRRSEAPGDARCRIRAGASYLVVGRPITQAPDPARAAEAILQEMAAAIAF